MGDLIPISLVWNLVWIPCSDWYSSYREAPVLRGWFFFFPQDHFYQDATNKEMRFFFSRQESHLVQTYLAIP